MDKLLKLIEENARISNEKLAVMTGKKVEEVAADISALEHEGIIRGYKAVIDWEKTDRPYVSAMIELKVTPRKDTGFDGVADTIMHFEEVDSVYLMSGGYDLAVNVHGRTFRDVALFVARRLSTLEGVVSTGTHFVLQKYKDRGILLKGEQRDMRGDL